MQPKKSKRLLIVEDETDVRKALATALTLRGYDIIEAEDGRKALYVFRTDEIGFSAVVTDFQIPWMNGVLLTEAIRQLEPAQKIVIMSGDADSIPRILKNLNITNVQVLKKPFAPKKLIELIENPQ